MQYLPLNDIKVVRTVRITSTNGICFEPVRHEDIQTVKRKVESIEEDEKEYKKEKAEEMMINPRKKNSTELFFRREPMAHHSIPLIEVSSIINIVASIFNGSVGKALL